MWCNNVLWICLVLYCNCAVTLKHWKWVIFYWNADSKSCTARELFIFEYEDSPLYLKNIHLRLCCEKKWMNLHTVACVCSSQCLQSLGALQRPWREEFTLFSCCLGDGEKTTRQKVKTGVMLFLETMSECGEKITCFTTWQHGQPLIISKEN